MIDLIKKLVDSKFSNFTQDKKFEYDSGITINEATLPIYLSDLENIINQILYLKSLSVGK
jgi:hypothetical protein